MQVTVDIPDEIASRILSSGLTVQLFVEQLVHQAEVKPGSIETGQPKRPDLNAFFEAMLVDSKSLKTLPEEAFLRESFYTDHER